MAFLPGLKKQINKANQFMSEKISGVEGTKLDDDFHTMERKTDVYVDLVDELQIKTKEYLQPNPTVRAKMAAVKGISKLSGQAKASTYPQPEGTLGEAMANFGNKLLDFDNSSVFGSSLMESGESLKQMADLKYALDDNVKQNFLEPLHHLQTKDLKEVAHHRKKLQGRKLDFDCKKRKQQSGGQTTEKEIKQAEDKFGESLHLAQMGMHNIMENDVEQISQLAQFAEALLEYHRACADILQSLTDTLYTKTNDAGARTRREFTPKTLEDLGVDTTGDYSSGGGVTAPNAERAMRNSNSSRKGRSSSTVRSASATPSNVSSSSAGGFPSNNSATAGHASFGGGQSGRPSSQPTFSTQIANLDPWESAEINSRVPVAGQAAVGGNSGWSTSNNRNINNQQQQKHNNNLNHNNNLSKPGWTVFPESSPAPAQRSATAGVWGGGTSSLMPPPSAPPSRYSSAFPAVNSASNNNGFTSSFNSNLPVSGSLISPAASPAGTPSHQPSGQSSGFGDWSGSGAPSPSPATTPTKSGQPSAQALYDFEPENPGELAFKEGDIIHLKQKLDENWFEGTINGKTGFFPINYVDVLVNLP